MAAFFIFFVGALFSASYNPVNARECGETGVICHGLQKDCQDSDFRACEVLAKIASLNADSVWIDLSAHAGMDHLHLNFTNRWIGVGFSLTGKMPNTAVVNCFQDADDAVHAKLTFNVPDKHLNIGWKDVDQTPLKVESAKLENGKLHCVVQLQKKFKINETDFDLSKEHHLLVATGRLRAGTISKHDRAPAISEKVHIF